MRLTVLGCDGGWPAPGGATSGYLLSHDGFDVLLDAGTGTLASLLRRLDVLDVDAVVLSHEHPDHFVDVFGYFVGRFFHPERPAARVPLFLPEGMVSKLTAIQANLTEVLEPHELRPGDRFDVGPFEVRVARMDHPPPTLGYRFEAGRRSLAYSADTGPTDELVELARDADVLLAEATWGRAQESTGVHLSGAQAGDHAKRAGVERLVATHLWPTYDRDAIVEEAVEAFAGDVVRATRDLEVEV